MNSLEGRSERPTLHPPRRFSVGWLISVAAHVVIVAALVWTYAGPPRPSEPSLISANIVELPAPEPPGPPGPPGVPDEPAVAAPASAQQPPAPVPEPVPEPKPVQEPAVTSATAPDTADLLSDSQLIGAASADDDANGGGSGGGGSGACNMGRVLQQALRRDPMVKRAVEEAGRAGNAVMLWNGDWVRSGDQDGKGLSGVRQAITMELAFAPAACRTARVHELVLLSLADGTRFAIGADEWRWSDLLGLSRRPAAR